MILLIQAFHIVVSDNVQAVDKRFGSVLPQEIPIAFRVLGLILPFCQLVIQAAPEGTDPVADRPGTVEAADGIRQTSGPQVTFVQPAAFRDFISR